MTALVVDTFTRADSAVTMGNAETGQTWVNGFGTWGISSNKAYVATSGGAQSQSAIINSGVAGDAIVTCDITLSATNDRAVAGVFVKSNNVVGQWLIVQLKKTTGVNELSLLQLNGGFAVLGSDAAAGLVNGQTYAMRAVIIGSTVTVYVDNVLRFGPTAINASVAALTYSGLLIDNSTGFDDLGSRHDNFIVSDRAPVPMRISM